VAWTFGIAHHKLLRAIEKGRVEDRARRKLGLPPLVLEDEALERVARLGGDTRVDALLVDPYEILTAATFAPVRRATIGCASLPAVTMQAGQALVTVQERRAGIVATPRPQRFVMHPSSPAFAQMIEGCIPGAAVPSVDNFSEGSRAFTSIVVLAPGTTHAVRVQALQILDRLRFTATAPAVPAASRGSG
jgi:hypothetical protein